ncbi:MAG: hypothetical protein ACYTEQ_14415 [Planctomycetota bacterium]|jgi:DNA-binding PadR family transcriptional regulator
MAKPAATKLKYTTVDLPVCQVKQMGAKMQNYLCDLWNMAEGKKQITIGMGFFRHKYNASKKGVWKTIKALEEHGWITTNVTKEEGRNPKKTYYFTKQTSALFANKSVGLGGTPSDQSVGPGGTLSVGLGGTPIYKEYKRNNNNGTEVPERDNISSASTGSKSFEKPTAAAVKEYAASIGYELDGDEFCDFYESKGWVVGKSPMKSWQACVRTWKRKNSPGDNGDAWEPPTIEEVNEELRRADAQYYQDTGNAATV